MVKVLLPERPKHNQVQRQPPTKDRHHDMAFPAGVWNPAVIPMSVRVPQDTSWRGRATGIWSWKQGQSWCGADNCIIEPNIRRELRTVTFGALHSVVVNCNRLSSSITYIMAGFVQNILWNSVSGFVEAGTRSAGEFAGNALIKAGDLVENSGRSVGTGESPPLPTSPLSFSYNSDSQALRKKQPATAPQSPAKRTKPQPKRSPPQPASPWPSARTRCPRRTSLRRARRRVLGRGQ
jgi:hypothetical protein